jgi:hypothetical protein
MTASKHNRGFIDVTEIDPTGKSSIEHGLAIREAIQHNRRLQAERAMQLRARRRFRLGRDGPVRMQHLLLVITVLGVILLVLWGNNQRATAAEQRAEAEVQRQRADELEEQMQRLIVDKAAELAGDIRVAADEAKDRAISRQHELEIEVSQLRQKIEEWEAYGERIDKQQARWEDALQRWIDDAREAERTKDHFRAVFLLQRLVELSRVEALDREKLMQAFEELLRKEMQHASEADASGDPHRSEPNGGQ